MTNAELAILSLIVEQPRHGYNLEQVIEERGMRNWTEIGFSSIYYILRKLEKQGLISSTTKPSEGKGPGRKEFRATKAGYQIWNQAALDSLKTITPMNKPFLIGLSVLPALSQEDSLDALSEYQRKLKTERDNLQNRWKEQADRYDLPLYVEGMFDYGMVLIETELTWIEDFIKRLIAKE